MKRFVLEFLCSLLFAGIGFLALAGLYNLADLAGLGIDFGGDKGPALSGILIGLSLGGVVGIIFARRIILREYAYCVPGILLAVILSILGNYLGLVLMDKLGSRIALLLPFLTAMACVMGYSVGAKVKW